MQDINISTIIGSTVPVEEQLKLIKNAGFIPVERDSMYNEIRTFL